MVLAKKAIETSVVTDKIDIDCWKLVSPKLNTEIDHAFFEYIHFGRKESI